MGENNNIGKALGYILWAVVFGILAYAEYGGSGFWFGAGLSIAASIVSLLGIIPFLGLILYNTAFGWVSANLLLHFGFVAGITVAILYWLGFLLGIVISAIVVIAILMMLINR